MLLLEQRLQPGIPLLRLHQPSTVHLHFRHLLLVSSQLLGLLSGSLLSRGKLFFNLRDLGVTGRKQRVLCLQLGLQRRDKALGSVELLSGSLELLLDPPDSGVCLGICRLKALLSVSELLSELGDVLTELLFVIQYLRAVNKGWHSPGLKP